MKPKLITQRMLIQSAPEIYREQYPDDIDRYNLDRGAKYRALLALDRDTCPASEVDAIVGNSSWTKLRCDGCDRDDVTSVVEVGDLPDYDSRSCRLCPVCLADAYGLV